MLSSRKGDAGCANGAGESASSRHCRNVAPKILLVGKLTGRSTTSRRDSQAAMQREIDASTEPPTGNTDKICRRPGRGIGGRLGVRICECDLAGCLEEATMPSLAEVGGGW